MPGESNASLATRKVRVAAYAVCVRDGRVLLARWVGPKGKLWTLPGGGVDHGEDPYDAVRREVTEETGHTVEVERLVGVHSDQRVFSDGDEPPRDLHSVRIVYAARVVGGELRDEVDGSTDTAAWFGLDEVDGLARVPWLDAALELDRVRPAGGNHRRD
ncbi:NUDIX hydrolase [Solihabitans fulvus]|uniref:NUDIX hydrolase n=2 Tax=Solihabitans fulvus TaxID=1892852 RepID=A0A5B2WVH9_9PSEU|nr:NUDIX hydrolase [Solihabitans fulvus]